MAKAQKRTSETVVWDKELPGLGLRSRKADDNKGTNAVKDYLNTKAKLSDYCAEQGVDQKWLTKELVAFRKTRKIGRKAVQ